MESSLFHSVWTVIVLILFVGIVAWAWSGRQKQRFDEAAHIPFDDDEGLAPEIHSKENNHG